MKGCTIYYNNNQLTMYIVLHAIPFELFAYPPLLEFISRVRSIIFGNCSLPLSLSLSTSLCVSRPLSPSSPTLAEFVFSLHFLFGQQQSKHLWLSEQSRTGSPSRRPCNDCANLFAAQSQQPPLHFLLLLCSLTLPLLDSLSLSLFVEMLPRLIRKMCRCE